MNRFSLILSTLTVVVALVLFTTVGLCASVKSTQLTGQVNINTATVEELTLLPRIGAKVAQRIVDYRQAQGPFKTIDELKNVKGIGDKTFDRFEKLVKVSGKTDLRLSE